MKKVKDQQLIDELQQRFNDNFQNLKDQNELIKQLETVNKKLKESESLKTNFLSNIKNEINNPLTSVLGLAKVLISDNSNDPAFIKKIATHIFNDISNLDFQLRNVFAAAEIEAGEAHVEITAVNVQALIGEIIESCKIKTEAKNITISLNAKGKKTSKAVSSLHSFKTDKAKLQLIILNLLLNGIEFTPDGGSITVTIKTEERSLILTFQDSGKGIKREEKTEIFNRFKQGGSGRKKNHKGQGLGLTVTKELVESLNGKITFESSEKGSSFKVVFTEFNFSNHDNSDINDVFFANPEKF